MSILLQRGQGSILSGFLRFLSCDLLVSLSSSSVFEVFKVVVSLSMGRVMDSSQVPEAVSGLLTSSNDWVGAPSSFFLSVGFSPSESWIHENPTKYILADQYILSKRYHNTNIFVPLQVNTIFPSQTQ